MQRGPWLLLYARKRSSLPGPEWLAAATAEIETAAAAAGAEIETAAAA